MRGRGRSGPRWRRPLLILALGILLGGCAPATLVPSVQHHSTLPVEPSFAVPSGDVTRLVISGNTFGPPEITVAVGFVTFVNAHDEPHTVTEGEDGAAAPDGRFDVFIDIGDSAEVEFPDPGDYLVTCQFHGEMRLLVHAH